MILAAANNEAIATEVGFDLLSPVDSDNESIDEPEIETEEGEDTPSVPHVGLASNDETRIMFQNNRTDKRKTKSVHRKKGEQPTKLSHLTTVAATKAEQECWLASAKAIDGTCLKIAPPGCPKRTTITVTVNEFNDSGKDGGKVATKKLRRAKPLITVVAASREDFRYAWRELQHAFTRGPESCHEDYEIVKLFRDHDDSSEDDDNAMSNVVDSAVGDGEKLQHVVQSNIDQWLKKRKNPSRRKRDSRECIVESQMTM
jgi:hypothetical protein